MWKGRFDAEQTDLVQRYGESVSYDWRLYRQDIRGSMAHAEALVAAGILKKSESNAIRKGLRAIEKEIDAGKFEFSTALEDIHMNIEAALTKRIGPAGAKLHTARSRNDQVSTDVRLYCREQCDAITEQIRVLQKALVQCGSKNAETVLPGYTHLQRAQPVLFAHHLLAYVEMLARDVARIADCRKRLNVLPLGSGALAGSTIVLDRKLIAQELGFDGVSANSMDAVSDRDFIAELLFALALAGIHLSRLSEDLILWASSEFNFITLSDAHTTGSSLMPQKKNPDMAELTRGKTGRLLGNLVSLMTTLKGLPMTYNRDLQEDKEPLFDSIDTIRLALEVYAEMIEGIEVKTLNTAVAADDPFLLATDIADYLVLRGVPFREAHEVVGRLTAHCVAESVSYPDLSLKQLQKFSTIFEKDVYKLFDVPSSLRARKAPGAPSPANVTRELKKWGKRLGS